MSHSICIYPPAIKHKAIHSCSEKQTLEVQGQVKTYIAPVEAAGDCRWDIDLKKKNRHFMHPS